MKVEIDQSGKVEKTNHPTVLGLSSLDGSVSGTILISAKVKQEIQRQFRSAGRPRAFISRVFCAGVVRLLQRVGGWSEIVIDTEYPGHEEVIRRTVLELAEKVSLVIDANQISFMQIGKRSKAHSIAYHAFKNRNAHSQLSAHDIILLLL